MSKATPTITERMGLNLLNDNNPSLSSQNTLLRQLLTLAIPISVAAMVQTSYHLINAFWVGRIDPDAVAVITLCFPVLLIMISIGSGLSLGGSILIAQAYGAQNRDRLNHLASQTIIALVLLALLLSCSVFLAAPAIIELLGAADHLVDTATRYLRISVAGTVFMFLSLSYQAVLRALGSARAPLLVIVPSVALNGLLDPVFIFGWGPMPALGVTGAAYGTVITQFITACAGIWLMLRPRFGLTINRQHLKPHGASTSAIVRLGLPASVEQAMGAASVAIITTLAAAFGTTAIASYGIVFRITTFTIIPIFGISMATSILIGQSLGAGTVDQCNRIARQAAMLALMVMSSISVSLFLLAMPVARLFVPADPALVEYAATVLRIFSLSFPFIGVQMALTGAFRGAGDTFSAMVITLAGTWLIQIPLAISLSRMTALEDMGLWWSAPLAGAINVTIVTLYYRTGRWRKRLARR